jgi:hypothetical protein
MPGISTGRAYENVARPENVAAMTLAILPLHRQAVRGLTRHDQHFHF